ncbi:hypothetical protein EYF80_030932 [Liparis tanakae]|uniref:Uncharacterized protein n=1 Tax=Liparis tanakae TaxID=230148 RepID=A0A4Z2GZE7_9TELE|nr:hypothetical protein EYF80_030932 [Liparis tanakae]
MDPADSEAFRDALKRRGTHLHQHEEQLSAINQGISHLHNQQGEFQASVSQQVDLLCEQMHQMLTQGDFIEAVRSIKELQNPPTAMDRRPRCTSVAVVTDTLNRLKEAPRCEAEVMQHCTGGDDLWSTSGVLEKKTTSTESSTSQRSKGFDGTGLCMMLVFNVYFSVANSWLSSHIWLFRLVRAQLIEQLIDAAAGSASRKPQRASFSRGMSFCLYASRNPGKRLAGSSERAEAIALLLSEDYSSCGYLRLQQGVQLAEWEAQLHFISNAMGHLNQQLIRQQTNKQPHSTSNSMGSKAEAGGGLLITASAPRRHTCSSPHNTISTAQTRMHFSSCRAAAEWITCTPRRTDLLT